MLLAILGTQKISIFGAATKIWGIIFGTVTSSQKYPTACPEFVLSMVTIILHRHQIRTNYIYITSVGWNGVTGTSFVFPTCIVNLCLHFYGGFNKNVNIVKTKKILGNQF